MKTRTATCGECWRYARGYGFGWFSASMLTALMLLNGARIEVPHD